MGPHQLASTIRHIEVDGLYLILMRSSKVSPNYAGHIQIILLPNKRDMKITYEALFVPMQPYTYSSSSNDHQKLRFMVFEAPPNTGRQNLLELNGFIQ